jgi:hypothetical protein
VKDAKGQTDAILVVEAFDAATQAATTQEMTAANWATIGGAIPVTPVQTPTYAEQNPGAPTATVASFLKGDAILMSNSTQASWGILQADGDPGAGTVKLVNLTNVLPPSIGAKAGQPTVELKAGATVRRARARLYYVDSSDELVRLTLSVPRAPQTGDALAPDPTKEVMGREIMAQGVENMKVTCQTDAGVGLAFGGCPAQNVAAAPCGDATLQAEAVTTFGGFVNGGGPLFSASQNCPDVSMVRAISLSVSVRNTCPGNATCAVDPNQSDQPAALPGALGAVALPDPTATTKPLPYARRMYRINAALRNQTLGVL